ncbi:hypothetical protein [Paludibaculum fermentans]|uniref:Uncharacterized protein n=1 Tax=Paludibaculum fermentans TaxID=1473598 RepID=A0A7S7NXZ1_PALFE|nr:hypothetical protein [Paludibaculum fermentans]QOY91861.1 hypothetical protein IRI77_18545 [Paludibaculum fermentans]
MRSALCPARDRLLASWQKLGVVRAADAETLFHVLVVLLETVPELPSAGVVDPLPSGWSETEVPVRATAANPRAYRGTKYQPPKRRRLPETDVRPHLCHARALPVLVAPLLQFLGGVRARLLKAGYSASALDGLEPELQPGSFSKAPWRLPGPFVRLLWPTIRTKPVRQQSRLLALFSRLSLGIDARALSAFARLVSLGDAEGACAWGEASGRLATVHRPLFFQLVLETGSHSAKPSRELLCAIEEAGQVVADEHLAVWLEQLLLTAPSGASSDYLMAGLRLTAQFNPQRRFDEIGQCSAFPEQVVREVRARLELSPWLVSALWEMCGRMAGLAEAIARSRWREFAIPAASRYFEMLVSVEQYDMPQRTAQRKWGAIAGLLARMEEVVLGVRPEYQEKWMEHVADWLWYWDNPTTIRRCLPVGFTLLSRICATPFGLGSNAARAWLTLLEMERETELARLVAAPDRCLQVLEKACERDSDSVLLARGLGALAKFQAVFIVNAFLAEPKRLCRSAKVLGSMSAPLREQVVKEARGHPLFRIDPTAKPVKEVCREIAENLRDGYENPVPARLKSWLQGEVTLTPARLERYQRVLSQNLVLTRLSVIEAAALAALQRGLPAMEMTGEGEHALRLLGSIGSNRRGLRKFLRAYWAGDTAYLAKHPATNEWYRKHPGVAREVWERGIPFESGCYRIELEQDPFEVLKLGTYVGSCLAVGGLCSESAVAALVDVNKQVLYLRDERRRVIARQLIAISDDDRLVCFPVYPGSAAREAKTLFRDFDYAFAAELGVPVYVSKEGDDDYSVGCVLSDAWWDDGSWDFEVGAALLSTKRRANLG